MRFQAEVSFIPIVNERLELPLPIDNSIPDRDRFHLAGIRVHAGILEMRVNHRRFEAIIGIRIRCLALFRVRFIRRIPDSAHIGRIELLNKPRRQFSGAEGGSRFVLHTENHPFAIGYPPRFIVSGDDFVPTLLRFAGIPENKRADEVGIKRFRRADASPQDVQMLFPFRRVVHIAFEERGGDTDNFNTGTVKQAFHRVNVSIGEFMGQLVPHRPDFDGVEVKFFHKVHYGSEVLRDLVANHAEFKHSCACSYQGC